MKSFRQRVLEAVLRLGTCSIDQVIAACGRYVSSSQAAACCRRSLRYERTRKKKVSMRKENSGVRMVVNAVLVTLFKYGHIRRISRGVYAAPLPKLFQLAKGSA